MIMAGVFRLCTYMAVYFSGGRSADSSVRNCQRHSGAQSR